MPQLIGRIQTYNTTNPNAGVYILHTGLLCVAQFKQTHNRSTHRVVQVNGKGVHESERM